MVTHTGCCSKQSRRKCWILFDPHEKRLDFLAIPEYTRQQPGTEPDATLKLWDAGTGEPIGAPMEHDQWVDGAVYNRDETRILTWSRDGTARQWDVRWAMRNPTEPKFLGDLYREKLIGASVKDRITGVPVGVRNIDKTDTDAAPILRGREGEDVCAPPPTTLQTLRALLR